jgi:hypothetical protein
VEEELGHMEGKKVLEELVGACAMVNIRGSKVKVEGCWM